MSAQRHSGWCRRLVLLAVLFLPALAGAAEVLRVLAWPGYADPDVVKAFEQRTGARVEVSYVDSDDLLWQRISHRQAVDFDVFAVNTAELQRYIAAGLVVPVDTGSIPRLAAQLPRFRDPRAIPGLAHDDKVFAIPYAYAEMGLIYDRGQLAAAPESIAVLWDPRYRGKVLAYNGGSHNFALAALSLGRNPFHFATADWPAAVERLIALRRNVLTFYTQPEESVELFRKHRAAVLFANYGSQQVQLLKSAGVDIGYAVPREGALAWLDCWAITHGVRNPALAHAWIDYLLEPEPAGVLLTRHGLANTGSPSPHHDPGDRLLWLEPVEDPEKRIRLWSRIISGALPGKVLDR